jgi:hypothetical protein
MYTELKVFFEIFFNTINEINENKTNIPLRNSALAITRNLYFDILMEITNELRNNQETINESNNFQNNIINGFQTAQNSFSMTPFLTNSINMITVFSTKSKEIISDYLDIILSDSFKINSFNNRTKLYFRKIQLEIFLRWKKTTSNDYNEDIMEFNNLVSKYQVNYSNYIDLFQIISLLCNINNESILEIIQFYEKLLKKYEKYDKLKKKLSSNKDESKKDESKKDESKKDESKKDESKKDESKKDESKKDESKKDIISNASQDGFVFENLLYNELIKHFTDGFSIRREKDVKNEYGSDITAINFEIFNIIKTKDIGIIPSKHVFIQLKWKNKASPISDINHYIKCCEDIEKKKKLNGHNVYHLYGTKVAVSGPSLIALNKLKLSENIYVSEMKICVFTIVNKVLAFYGKKQIKESNLNKIDKIVILREITY